MADVELEVNTISPSEELARLVKCSGEALQFLYVDIPSDVLVDVAQAGQGRLETALHQVQRWDR